MLPGPVFRILAQVAVMSVNVVTKAFVQAYENASRNPGAAAAAATAARGRGKMAVTQARQVLNLEGEEALTKEAVMRQYVRYFETNNPEKGGSVYLQAKIFHAKEALMEELGVPPGEREPPAPEGEAAPAEGEAGGEPKQIPKDKDSAER